MSRERHPLTPRSRSSPCHAPAPGRCAWGFLRFSPMFFRPDFHTEVFPPGRFHIVPSISDFPANRSVFNFRHWPWRSNQRSSSFCSRLAAQTVGLRPPNFVRHSLSRICPLRAILRFFPDQFARCRPSLTWLPQKTRYSLATPPLVDQISAGDTSLTRFVSPG